MILKNWSIANNDIVLCMWFNNVSKQSSIWWHHEQRRRVAFSFANSDSSHIRGFDMVSCVFVRFSFQVCVCQHGETRSGVEGNAGAQEPHPSFGGGVGGGKDGVCLCAQGVQAGVINMLHSAFFWERCKRNVDVEPKFVFNKSFIVQRECLHESFLIILGKYVLDSVHMNMCNIFGLNRGVYDCLHVHCLFLFGCWWWWSGFVVGITVTVVFVLWWFWCVLWVMLMFVRTWDCTVS